MKYIGAALLRDDGQPGDRRPRLDVGRRAQRARRWRCSARTSRANTGASRPRRSASASGGPRRPSGSKSSASSATSARMARRSRAPTTIYWPMKRRAAISGGAFVQRSMAYAIRSSRLQSPGFLAEVQQAVWSINPESAARARADAAADLQRVDGADVVRAGDPRHRRVGDAAARPGRHLRRDCLHRVAAPARSRHSHGARRASGESAADVRRRAAWSLTAWGWSSAWSAAAALMRLMSSLLFGVNPFDPLTYAPWSPALGGVGAGGHVAAGAPGDADRSDVGVAIGIAIRR